MVEAGSSLVGADSGRAGLTGPAPPEAVGGSRPTAGPSSDWRSTSGSIPHGRMAMNIRNFAVSLLTFLLLASIWGCGATRTREGTGEYVDDSVITTKVKAAIFNDSTLKVKRDQRGDEAVKVALGVGGCAGLGRQGHRQELRRVRRANLVERRRARSRGTGRAQRCGFMSPARSCGGC